MKMKSSTDDCRFYDYPLRTWLVYDHEYNSPITNLGECSCGSCDYCQNVCGCECDCSGCEENKVNGFYDENLNYKWIDGVLVCMEKNNGK